MKEYLPSFLELPVHPRCQRWKVRKLSPSTVPDRSTGSTTPLASSMLPPAPAGIVTCLADPSRRFLALSSPSIDVDFWKKAVYSSYPPTADSLRACERHPLHGTRVRNIVLVDCKIIRQSNDKRGCAYQF